MGVTELLVLVAMVTAVTSKCLVDRPDVLTNRSVYFNGKEFQLRVEGSTRISHQLANNILKILLEEVLGYKPITIMVEHGNTDAEQVIRRVSGDVSSSPTSSLPETMVNLEVWMLPGFNIEAWVRRGKIIDCGPLGPLAAFGWYMSSFTVKTIDHYRNLKLPTVTAQFSYRGTMHSLRRLMVDPNTQRYYCQTSDCDEGIFYPPWCQSGPHVNKCALLFSDYPATDSGVLQNQIKHFKLYVNIVWIGPHLTEFIKNQTRLNQPTLFFSWRPNVFMSGTNFTRIAFPGCTDSLEAAKPYTCDFPVNQLSKVVWSPLRTKAPVAFHLISQMSFTNKAYQNLLNTYREHLLRARNVREKRLLKDVACGWVQQNKDVWKTWLPHDLSNKTKIYIGGMISLSGQAYRDPGIVDAVEMATDLINKNSTLLAGYSLQVLIRDTQCLPDEVMKAFIDYITNVTHPIAGVLGPACSPATIPLARVSKHFHTIVLSYGAEALELSKRDVYPLFFRTVPNFGQYESVFVEAFKKFKWKRVGMIVAVEHYAFLQALFKQNNISIVLYLQLPKYTHKFNAESYLAQLKEKNVKVIIGEFYDYAARPVMCGALKLGMTAREGYQWFLPGWYTMGWWETDRYNTPYRPDRPHIKEEVPCTTAEMVEAINGYMLLSQAYFDKDSAVATGTGNITVRDWKKTYRSRLQKKGYAYSDIANYAGYAYDAVWVYAFALDRLLREHPEAIDSIRSKKSSDELINNINRTDFKGVTGQVSFSGADRPGIILLQQFFKNNLTTIGRYVPTSGKGGKMEINMSLIKWLTANNQKPDDGSVMPEICQIESFRAFFNVDCNMAIVLANVFGFGSLVIIMIIIPILIKNRYDKKSRATRARMKELGLMSPDIEWLNLDGWEMPREKVVLNRKLGEGAFGTVFGGEAYMDTGSNWVACAVKTLKVGSSPQEKLDFLTEASLMKRFDHENIVKLLGVCTRGEPAYCVMEFMLHGDLKTYMLARRQLVGKNPENKEISPSCLTKMVLDVINGLIYLSDNKYVHRDLACRNCLVNDGSVVKIGDFGMTRPMVETDYYRFSRKGMLPVRWMAPESLRDGIFHTPSDIWSYGVLLFEVLTFGSFPYQGLSNTQVLEFVKNGNKLNIPTACSKEMDDLLEACWQYEYEDRPTPQAIMEYLKDHPNLIIPCLDTPSSAVVIEGTDSLEFAISPRRHTTTSRSFSGSASAGLLQHLSAMPEAVKLLQNKPNEDSTTVTRSNSGDSGMDYDDHNSGYVRIQDPAESSDHLNHSKEVIHGSRDRVTRSLDKLCCSKDKIPAGNRENLPKEILKYCENDHKNHTGNSVNMATRYISLPLEEMNNGDCRHEQLTQV